MHVEDALLYVLCHRHILNGTMSGLSGLLLLTDVSSRCNPQKMLSRLSLDLQLYAFSYTHQNISTENSAFRTMKNLIKIWDSWKLMATSQRRGKLRDVDWNFSILQK